MVIPRAAALLGWGRCLIRRAKVNAVSATNSLKVSALTTRSWGMLTDACHAQVTNCYAELSQAHGQHIKTCNFHMEASAVMQAGQLMRYCHLCSSLHLPEEFDGDSRC